MGCFESVSLLTSKNLGSDYWETCGDFVRTHPHRGYGFWTWKPYIIYKRLAELPASEVLLYVDAGCSLNVEGGKRLHDYIQQAISHPSGWFVFQAGGALGPYTKRSLLKMHNMDREEVRQLPMLQTGCQFIVASPNNVDFARQWFESMLDGPLIDDSAAKDEYFDFIAHRHDQSVFSLLAHRRGLGYAKNETEWSPSWGQRLEYPIHTRRWKHYIGWPTEWLRRPWLGSFCKEFESII